MPIPIVKKNGKWLFDPRRGRARCSTGASGSNELDAIEICHDYVARSTRTRSRSTMARK